MADSDVSGLDFSDLPAVKAENAQVLEDAGVSSLPAELPIEESIVLDDAALQDVGHELELQQKYGDSPFTTFAESAAGMASFSLTDRIAQKLGITTEEAQRERAERNPVSKGLGEAAGLVGSAVATGGESLLAKAVSAPMKTVTTSAKAAEQMVADVIAKSTSKKIAQSVLKKSIQKATGGAVEGAAISTGQLLREDALGESDLNAENLMSAAGTGALYGGLISAALPPVGAMAKGVGKGAKSIFDKTVAKYANPTKAAEELTGFSLTKLAKLSDNPSGKQLLEDLPTWYANEVKIGAMDSSETVLNKIKRLQSESAAKINQVLTSADDLAKTRLSGPTSGTPLRKRLLSEIADDVEAEFHTPYKDMKSLNGQNRKVKNLLDDLRVQAAKDMPLTGADLVDLKRKIDKIAQSFYDRAPGAKPKISELAAFRARDLMNKASIKYVEFVDKNLAAELVQANKNYHYASTVRPSLLKKAVKDKDFVQLKDAIYGAAGVALGGGPLGAAVIAGKKFLESDLRRKLVILSGIEKANLSVAQKTKAAVTDFFNYSKGPVKLAGFNSILSSPIAMRRVAGEAAEAPKNKKEAYANASENLSNLVVKSDTLLEKATKVGAPLSYAAPETAAALGNKVIDAVNFLQSKIPKRPYDAVFPSGKNKPYEPSSLELAKFERYLQVVDNPMSVLQDIKQGTLTSEHVEALRMVYPTLYREVQIEVLKQLQTAEEGKIPYSRRVQLSMLLNIPGDATLQPNNIAALQGTFSSQAQQQEQGLGKPSAAGAREIQSNERAEGGVESFMKRRQQP